MKVLVVGGGGREHALCWKLAQSPLLSELFCVPGNPGTAEIARNLDLDVSNLGALAVWAANKGIDLTVVGPEAPLADGLTDIFAQHGLKVFGPTREAARMEASKSFAKELMLKSGVKTAKGEVFQDVALAKEYVRSLGAPIVVKADGLAAGKGVVVADSVELAEATLDEFMVEQRFGESSQTVVVEECLQGKEASVIAIVDGDTVLPLVVSQDYKRQLDGDQGPNTGGMGAISPTPVLGDKAVENLVGEIFMPVIGELLSRGISYRGFLYAGVMVDDNGNASVLEFNCRMGDPEAQPLMMRLDSDLLAVLYAAVNGTLGSVELKWRTDCAACIVASSKGYPGVVEDGKKIEGLFAGDSEQFIFHAGTTANDSGEIITKGGRVLAVTALGSTTNEALHRAYEGMAKIRFDGMHFRRDIGGGVW